MCVGWEVVITCSGHVLIGIQGEFLSVDAAFGAIMRTSAESMVGRAVIDVTAPADREECTIAIARLRATQTPFRISKRFLRDDGSLVWVTNSVSITGGSGSAPIIIASIDPIERPEETRTPAMLLDTARFVALCARERALVCGPEMLSEPAWEMILAAYIIEAEGVALDVETMADRGGMSARSANRWLAVLLDGGILELELTQQQDTAKAFRLTLDAHRRFEHYLSTIETKRRTLVMA